MARPSSDPNHWLEQRLAELRSRDKSKTKTGLAKAAFGSRLAAISEIVKNGRKISGQELIPMATYLEWTASDLLAKMEPGMLVPDQVQPIMAVGRAEAGVWRETVRDPSSAWKPALMQVDERYEGMAVFGLRVVGPAMDLAYPDGSTVACIDYTVLGRDPAPDDHVIVTRVKGDKIEVTVKELRRHADGTLWLWPRSSDPHHQTPWQFEPVGTAPGDGEIRILAKVVGSYIPRP